MVISVGVGSFLAIAATVVARGLFLPALAGPLHRLRPRLVAAGKRA